MDYRNNWDLWAHPVWNALLNNPAYYYYCTAKAALISQSSMVRKGNAVVRQQPAAAATTTPALPFGTAGIGGNGISSVLKLFGVEECPECKSPLDLNDNRPLREFCGHIRCRRCLIKATPCSQCKNTEKSNGVSATNGKISPNAGSRSRLQGRLQAAGAVTNTLPVKTYARQQQLQIKKPIYHPASPTKNADIRPSSNISPGRNLDPPHKPSVQPVTRAGTLALRPGSLGNSVNNAVIEKSNGSGRPPVSSNSAAGLQRSQQPQPNPQSVGASIVRFSDPLALEDNSMPSNGGEKSPSQGSSKSFGSIQNECENSCSATASNSPGTASSSSSTESFKEKRKKKRNPVIIHDHITVISGDPVKFQCNVCMKQFKTKAHIKYHEFCQKGEKPFKCPECGQGFIAKSHYEYHLRTHTGERPYVCPKCGKGFNQRGKVTRHMRSHTGEKPFVCDECGRGFANAQALRSHHLIHTGERPYACKYCNKRFTGMTNLKKHIITHTGERPYVCIHCSKSFGLKWTLDLHLRTHSSERPYACDQCTRAFSNSKDLRRHLVIHSGERPFKCWICGTAFRRKDNLDRHIKNTHNQPKDVAKQLANEAAAEYLANNSSNSSLPVPTSKVNSAVISNIIDKNQLTPSTSSPRDSSPKPSISSAKKIRKIVSKKKKAAFRLKTVVESDEVEESTSKVVIITAKLSPPSSPENTNEKCFPGTNEPEVQEPEENLESHLEDNEGGASPVKESLDFYSEPEAKLESNPVENECPPSPDKDSFNSHSESETKMESDPSSNESASSPVKDRNLPSSDCGIRLFDNGATAPANDTLMKLDDEVKLEILDHVPFASGPTSPENECTEAHFPDNLLSNESGMEFYFAPFQANQEPEENLDYHPSQTTVEQPYREPEVNVRLVYTTGTDQEESNYDENRLQLEIKAVSNEAKGVQNGDEELPEQSTFDATTPNHISLDPRPSSPVPVKESFDFDPEPAAKLESNPVENECPPSPDKDSFNSHSESETKMESDPSSNERASSPRDSSPKPSTSSAEESTSKVVIITAKLSPPSSPENTTEKCFPGTNEPEVQEPEENLESHLEDNEGGASPVKESLDFYSEPEAKLESNPVENECPPSPDKDSFNSHSESETKMESDPNSNERASSPVKDRNLPSSDCGIRTFDNGATAPANDTLMKLDDEVKVKILDHVPLASGPTSPENECTEGHFPGNLLNNESELQFYFAPFESNEEPAENVYYHPSQITVEHPYRETDQPENVSIVYATATAQAERNYDENGPPLKIRLLHAEALGVQNGGQGHPEQRLFYTSTQPNQVIPDTGSPAIALAPPAVIHPHPQQNCGNKPRPRVTVHQYRYDQTAPVTPISSSYPVQVLVRPNGIVQTQAISDYPDCSTLLHRVREARSALPDPTYNDWSTPQDLTVAGNSSLQPYRNSGHFSLGSGYSTSGHMDKNHRYFTSGSSHGDPGHDPSHSYYNGTSSSNSTSASNPAPSYSPLKALAAEATRRLNEASHDNYDATIAAAAAIAKVGEDARRLREHQLRERERMRFQQDMDERIRIAEIEQRDKRVRNAASRKAYY